MIKNHDKLVEINHNSNQLDIPNHSCRILSTGVSGSRKTNVLLNLIKNERPDIDKSCL